MITTGKGPAPVGSVSVALSGRFPLGMVRGNWAWEAKGKKKIRLQKRMLWRMVFFIKGRKLFNESFFWRK